MIASLIVALHLLGFVSVETAPTLLYFVGFLLFGAEIAIVSLGLLSINALMAIYAGYAIQIGQDLFFGMPIGWPMFFGIAFVEVVIIFVVVSVHLRLRKVKISTGIESMIGEKAKIIEWDGQAGSVSFEGEIWKAKSEKALELNPNEEVTVEAVNKIDLTISA